MGWQNRHHTSTPGLKLQNQTRWCLPLCTFRHVQLKRIRISFHAANLVQAAPLSCQLPEIWLPMTPRSSMLLAGFAFPGQSPGGHIVNAQASCNQMLLLVPFASDTAIQMQRINVKHRETMWNVCNASGGAFPLFRCHSFAVFWCFTNVFEVASRLFQRSLRMDIQRKNSRNNL